EPSSRLPPFPRWLGRAVPRTSRQGPCSPCVIHFEPVAYPFSHRKKRRKSRPADSDFGETCDYEKVADTHFGNDLRWFFGGGRLGAGRRRDFPDIDHRDD